MPASRSTKAASSATTPSSTGATEGRARQVSNFRKHAFQLRRHERLLQHRSRPVFLRHTALAIAGGKDERHAARGKGLGHREDVLALDLEVENGAIEIARLG